MCLPDSLGRKEIGLRSDVNKKWDGVRILAGGGPRYWWQCWEMVRLLHFLLLSANCGGPGGHGGVQYPWVSSPSSTLPRISKLPNTAVFPPSFNYLLHSNNVPINPISNVEQVSVGEIDLGNVTGCFFGCSMGGLETCNHLIASKAKWGWTDTRPFAWNTVSKLAFLDLENKSMISLKMWTKAWKVSWDQKRQTLGCSGSFHFQRNLFQIYPQALLQSGCPFETYVSL